MDIVLLFPGQGSQKPGMGRDLVEGFPAARDVFARADAALSAPLSRLCFEGPSDELTQTQNAQPALLAHSAAVWASTRDAIGANVVAAAGHSLGEFTAYYAAESLGLEAALRVVRRRGELMYQSGRERPGAMAAVVGDLHRPIEEICEQATKEAGLVVPANYNCPGQIVISGELSGVDRATAMAKAAGAKLTVRLNVSGAFHSPLMELASAGLSEALTSVSFSDPQFAVYANVNGEAVLKASRAKELLLQQLASPVRWTDEVRALAARYPQALYVEMGAGKVLVGLVKKIAPSLRIAACGTALEVQQLRELADT